MRFFYLILFFVLKYSLRIFYPRVEAVNSPKDFFGRTIYVSNHAASFMDPLVVATFRLPIVFFLTRADIFNKLTQPILWAAHMLPIYRQQDGGDTKDENIKTFDKCAGVLKYGRNLLIFGEGFTDDTFIRRLKPIKKGAVRIGFYTLEKFNWRKKIYIAAVGCNYSEPNMTRSDVLVSTSDKICLNDYRKEYETNPSKTINDLTKIIEDLMKAQITHIEKKELSSFHENIMRLTRKGMNASNSNLSISLIDRWKYSQSLAIWLNELKDEQLEMLDSLKKELDGYFLLLKRMRINENYVFELCATQKLNRTKELCLMFILFPFALLGLFHCGLAYVIVKRFVEKSFKRPVFWGSVKLLLGMISMGLLNIPFIFIFYEVVYPSYWLAFIYYLLIGLFGLAAYVWFQNYIRFKEKGVVSKIDLEKIIKTRQELITKIHMKIPIA